MTTTDDYCTICGRQGHDADRHLLLLHVITEHPDTGPDLRDLVRLIRYCREHDLCATVNDSQPLAWDGKVGQLAVRLYGPQPAIVLWEGDPAPRGAHFVGPDGTVYDANREAL